MSNRNFEVEVTKQYRHPGGITILPGSRVVFVTEGAANYLVKTLGCAEKRWSDAVVTNKAKRVPRSKPVEDSGTSDKADHARAGKAASKAKSD